MTAIRVLVLSMLCALLTWFAGWWAVIVLALVAGALWRRTDAARLVALSATLGWVALLAADAYGGGLGALARVVGGVFGAPAPVMLAATLAFVALGAWSAATIGAYVVMMRVPAVQRRGNIDRADTSTEMNG